MSSVSTLCSPTATVSPSRTSGATCAGSGPGPPRGTSRSRWGQRKADPRTKHRSISPNRAHRCTNRTTPTGPSTGEPTRIGHRCSGSRCASASTANSTRRTCSTTRRSSTWRKERISPRIRYQTRRKGRPCRGLQWPNLYPD